MNDLTINSRDLKDHRGWQLPIYRIKEALGFKEWPDAGIGTTVFGNVVIYVTPRGPTRGRGRAGMKHRAFVVCPHCPKHVPVGRYAQHLKVHKAP